MSDLLNSASLVMIPSGYKEDVVYSQIPTDGSGDLSFTRASNGTRVNSAGLVEVTPWNLAEYSEDFSNASWYKSNGVITANDTTAPNGTTTADKFGANGTLTSSYFFTSQYVITNAIVGQNYTITLYAKAGTLTQMLMYLGAQNGIYWNLSNGQFIDYWNGVQNITSYNSESVGNGWYKYTISIIASNTTVQIESYSSKNDNIVANYTTADNYYLWGAQLNIGSTAKPYFPTTDRLNVPRLTYQNGGGGCPSLLLEKQSTNYARKNNDLGDWTVVNSGSLTKNLNAATSPDGTTNAINLVPNTANSSKMIYDDLTTQSSGGNFTMSCYAKANGYSKFGIRESQTVGYYATFNLSTGTVIDNGGNTASIENVGNGWYRCIVSVAYSGIVNLGLLPLNDSYTSGQPLSHSYTGDGTKGVLVYGPQLEVSSSYATSLISTAGVASATRVADACSKTGISSLIGQTEGTLFVDVSGPSKTGDARYMTVSDGTASNRIVIYSTTLTSIGVYLQNSPSSSSALGFNTINGRMKIAFAYKNNDLRVYLNGILKDTITSFTSSFTLNSVTVGTYEDYQVYNSLDQSINEAIIFPTALTNAEAIALTTI